MGTRIHAPNNERIERVVVDVDAARCERCSLEDSQFALKGI